MAIQMPFGGTDSGTYTPADVQRRRRLAEALMADNTQAREPFGALAKALNGFRGRQESEEAARIEDEGIASANKSLAEMLADPNVTVEQLLGETGMGNPWANSQQQAILAQLVGEKIKPPAPYEPEFTTFSDPNGDMYRYDKKDPNAKPELFFDVPDAEEALDVTGESKLRTEYAGLPGTKDFNLQSSAYQRILDSAKDSSAAGDMALIFNFMKVLDPGSTVREGEYATAANAGSIPDRIQSLYNSVIKGEKLSPTIRKDFVERAGKLYQGAAGGQERINRQYTDLATQYEFDPNRVVTPIPKIGVLDPEFDITQYVDSQTGQQTAPIPLTEENAQAEYDALPSGAKFIGPDGKERVKP